MCDTGVVYKGPLRGPGAPKDAYTKSIADRDVCGMAATHLPPFNSKVTLALPLSVRVHVCRAQSPVQPQAHADIAAGKPRPAGIR